MDRNGDGGEQQLIARSGRPWRVLCLEDHPSAARELAEVVSPLARVVGAATVAQARTLIERDEVDAAVVDVHLPDGTGFDVVNALRNEGVALPALVLYGPGDEEVMRAARRAGAFVARKPVYAPALRAFLKRAWLAERGELTVAVRRFARAERLDGDEERLLRRALDGTPLQASGRGIVTRCGDGSLAGLLDRLLDEAIGEKGWGKR